MGLESHNTVPAIDSTFQKTSVTIAYENTSLSLSTIRQLHSLIVL